MNNELYSAINDPGNMPRGSPSYVQSTLQERLQNRINRLVDMEPAVAGQLESRSRRAGDIKRRVDALSTRVDNAARLGTLLHHNLICLRSSLDDFIAADVRAVMRRIVDEITASTDCINRLRSRARPAGHDA